MHKPSKYYRKETNSNFASLVWDKYNSQCLDENGSLPSVPQFQADDLKATFHKSFKLGCNHYARSCKLRHPVTGRLHTCRLCCEDEIEESNEDGEISPPLDRFSVTELLCMKCNSLQPTGRACINPECISKGAPFAKYVCTVCNLFDDEKNEIYHCPHCNVCRVGKGLGIDYEHCMECNVCIAIEDFKNHTCVPRRLAKTCDLCDCPDSLSSSTKPVVSMSCGHSFHDSCYAYFPHLRGSNKMICAICRREDEFRN